MKTRNLLLLAVGCGLAILLAGGVKLFQIGSSDSPPPPLELGLPGTIGDMTVTPLHAELVGDTLSVAVELQGVDDPDGATSFWLAAAGSRLDPVPGAPDACSSTSAAEPTRCTLTVAVTDVGGQRVLLCERTVSEREDRLRWYVRLHETEG